MLLEEHISFFQPPGLSGVEVLSVENGQRLWRVFHETYAICIIPRSTWGEWVYRGKTIYGEEGQLMLLEPGNLHTTKRMKKYASFQVFFIQPEVISNLSREIGLPLQPHLGYATFGDPRLFSAFSNLYLKSRGGCLLEKKSRFVDCLGHFLHQCTEKGRIPISERTYLPGLRRARDYILSRFSEPIELEDLASLAGLSRFHFLRSFSKVFGMPPHAYQNRIRIAKSRRLLTCGERQVFSEVGFSDQSHFIRQFKSVMGITPGHYAQMLHRPFSGAGRP